MSRRECCTCLYGDLESSAAPCSGCFETSNWEYVREIHVSELQLLRAQVKELQEQLCRENQCGACAKVKAVEAERDAVMESAELITRLGNERIQKARRAGAEQMRERIRELEFEIKSLTGGGTAEEQAEFHIKTRLDLYEKIENLNHAITLIQDIADGQVTRLGETVKSLLDEVSELKADAVRFKIHLEQKDLALKANAEEYRRLQAETKKIAIDFYYWWHNQPGTNTEQGFDDWWNGREAPKSCIYGDAKECKRECPACRFGGDSGMM